MLRSHKPASTSLHGFRSLVCASLVAFVGLSLANGCAGKTATHEGEARDELERLRRQRDRAFEELKEAPGDLEPGVETPRGEAGTPGEEARASLPAATRRTSRQRPEWVGSGFSSEYPLSKYIVGIGSCKKVGDDDYAAMAAAEDRARNAVAKTIRVRVQSEFMSAAEVVTEASSGETVVEKDAMAVMNQITSKADLDLEGLQIAHRWFDAKDDTYWALAALDRSITAEGILDRLNTLREQIRQDHQLGAALRTQGHAFRALRHLNGALGNSFGLLNYRAQLRVISPEHSFQDDPELVSLWREAAEAAGALRVGLILFAEVDGRASASAQAESELSGTLRALGLNTVKLAPPAAGVSYDDMKDTAPARLRDTVGADTNCLVLAHVAATHVASEPLVKLLIHFYQARGELVVLDLDEGAVVASAGFDLSSSTHTGNKERPRASAGALVKASQELGGRLRRELTESLNLIE